MKTKLFLFATVVVALASSLADAPLPNPYTFYSVSIRAGPSTGSGFFLQASNSVYLVTARHVLFNDKQSPTNWPLWFAEAECTFHASESSEVTMQIDLAALLAARQVRYSTNHDVAMVRVEECNPTNTSIVKVLSGVQFRTANGSVATMPSTLARKFDDVVVGIDVFLFGFPSSLGLAELPQIDPSLPLMRKAREIRLWRYVIERV